MTSTSLTSSHDLEAGTPFPAKTVNSDHCDSRSDCSFTQTQVARARQAFPLTIKGATPTVIPPEHPFRTLVLCFDGTGDQFDIDNSNVVLLFSMLKKDDTKKQMCYYQAGVGTYFNPQVATPFMSKISKSLDMALAWDLHAHVMDGYEFLMQNYTSGDRICLFGFSRGAYTARALAGMLHKVGLLPQCNHQQVPFAYKMFTRTDDLGWRQSTAFKKCFSIDVDIEFIGVWDTVNSVGIIPRRLPFTTSNTAVRTFRHALALDERRARHKANLWNRPSADEAKLGTDAALPASLTPNSNTTVTSLLDAKMNGDGGDGHTTNLSHFEARYEALYKKSGNILTDVEEVWFAGCHCDIGGGSVPNGAPFSLARIPLRWMIRECFKTQTGIMFDAAALRTIGLNPATLYPVVLAQPPAIAVRGIKLQASPKKKAQSGIRKWNIESVESVSELRGVAELWRLEIEAELKDATCPLYDQLMLAPAWWMLEVLPMKQRYQKSDNTWVDALTFNFAHPRFIPEQDEHGIKVHRSVRTRMQMEPVNGGKKYVPRARFDVEPEWVD
ncbi:hypothetical protein K439DRAFT_1387499 [Ramaria rubella]|nr:hypothetical protein K439DRAFT_1387499 [Ramaria rubella]